MVPQGRGYRTQEVESPQVHNSCRDSLAFPSHFFWGLRLNGGCDPNPSQAPLGWARQLCGEGGRSGCSGVKPPARAAVSKKQITSLWFAHFWLRELKQLISWPLVTRNSPGWEATGVSAQDPPPPLTYDPKPGREHFPLHPQHVVHGKNILFLSDPPCS